MYFYEIVLCEIVLYAEILQPFEFKIIKCAQITKQKINYKHNDHCCTPLYISVSYTHLDVYKRQVPFFARACNRLVVFLQCSRWLSFVRKVLNRIIEMCIRDRLTHPLLVITPNCGWPPVDPRPHQDTRCFRAQELSLIHI